MSLASYPSVMLRDRQRGTLRVCHAAGLVSVTVREYREVGAGHAAVTADRGSAMSRRPHGPDITHKGCGETQGL
jgi:hypothetical protein